jgi:hypothetical protein
MFVTGKWADDEDAEALLDGEGGADGSDEEDEALYGDFEDLETGEKHSAKDEGMTNRFLSGSLVRCSFAHGDSQFEHGMYWLL